MRDRFRFQPWYVKVYRYARYRPKWFVLSCWWIVRWFVFGAKLPEHCFDGKVLLPHPTRGEFVRHLWIVGRSRTDFDMKNYVYLDEQIMYLRQQAKREDSDAND